MGRKRNNKNRHLPPRMHQKGKSFYLAVWNGQKQVWTKLGTSYSDAMIEYCRLERVGNNPKEIRTFSDLADEWKLSKYPKLAESTRASYDLALDNIIPAFGEAEPNQITPAHIGRYMDLRSSKHSANKEMAVMSGIFKLGIRHGHVSQNPTALIEYHPTKRRERIITKAEWSAIQLAAPNDLVPVLMDLLYVTGLRIGDVLRLRFDDVKTDGIMVRQSKNSVSGMYEMTKPLAAIFARAKQLHVQSDIKKLIPAGTTIIHTRRMKPYTYYGLRSIFRRVVDRAKLSDIHIHDIRRTAVTNAKRQGRRPQDFSLHKTESEANAYVVEVPRVRPLEPML